MKLENLNPWNWFKHEEGDSQSASRVPATREGRESLPYSGSIFGLHREMDRLFNDAFSNFGVSPLRSGVADPEPSSELAAMFRPQIDVCADEKQYEVTLDVPGLKEADISIDVKGDILAIKGEKEEKSEDKDKHYYRVERSYGAFQRTLSLPDDANADDIRASLKDGVLTLEIPRQEKSAEDTRKISISS